jgi:hypothetical protein
LQVQDYPGLHSKTLSQKTHKNKKATIVLKVSEVSETRVQIQRVYLVVQETSVSGWEK